MGPFLTIILPPGLGVALTLAICGFALWKGGREERLASAAFLVSIAVTLLFRDQRWPALQRGAFVADSALLVTFFVMAMRTSRFWPLAAAGFQLLAVMTHVAKMIDPALQQWAYITAGVIWTYLVLVTIAIGTWNAWRGRSQPAKAVAAAPLDATRR